MKIHTIAIVFLLLMHSSSSFAQQDTSKSVVFEKVEVEASYPGGVTAWKNFLANMLNAGVPVDNGAPVGLYNVIIQFIVDKDGKISDFKALTNQGYGMESEVIRILKKSGDWQPATQNGRRVNAYRKQLVTFQVMDESFEISPYSIYEGKDEELTIIADNVNSEDLRVTISRGTITSLPGGKYIVHVNGAQRVLLALFNKKEKKEVGRVSLEVIAGSQ